MRCRTCYVWTWWKGWQRPCVPVLPPSMACAALLCVLMMCVAAGRKPNYKGRTRRNVGSADEIAQRNANDAQEREARLARRGPDSDEEAAGAGAGAGAAGAGSGDWRGRRNYGMPPSDSESEEEYEVCVVWGMLGRLARSLWLPPLNVPRVVAAQGTQAEGCAGSHRSREPELPQAAAREGQGCRHQRQGAAVSP